VPLSNALNPVDNFFNGTRSALGIAASLVGDLPQLSGAAGSLSGLDLDVVDVTPRLTAGDTQATVSATTNGDVYGLGAFVTSVSTLKPDFASTGKTVTNLTRNDGSFLVGDELEYVISTKNEGTDASADTSLTDKLPLGVTYKAGTLAVTAGANTGAKTDASADDQAEFDAGTGTVTFRIGTGANASAGGSLAINDTTTVRFRVTINGNANGNLANQATLTSKGAVGKLQNVPALAVSSTGNGGFGSPTVSLLDACSTNVQCSGGQPICDNAGAHAWKCRPCTAANGEADCKPTGGLCVVASNDPKVGQCVQCSADKDCKVGKCDLPTHACIDCTTNTDCANPNPSCLVGKCGPCKIDGDCVGNPSGGACETQGPLAGTCQPCTAQNVSACTPQAPRCDSPAVDRCVQCLIDSDCGSSTSGRVCNGQTKSCEDGCRETGGNGCGPGLVCDASGGNIGRCVTPGSDAGSRTDGGVGADGGGGLGPDDAALLEGGGLGCSSSGTSAGSAWPLLVVLAGILRRFRRSGKDERSEADG